MHDPLTGLFNRRYFDLSLGRELGRAQRTKEQFAVIMLDADHFKNYNDEHGHSAGDDLLRGLSKVLSQRIRTEDIAARWGGEELVLLMVNSSVETAFDPAEKIRQAVMRLPQPPGDSKASVSIGIAVYPENGITASELIDAADQALYKAKNRGRNCTEIADAQFTPIK